MQLSRRDACDEKSRERLQVAESDADEVVELLGAQAGTAGVGLRRAGDARLEADPRRLREALFNLVANGLDSRRRRASWASAAAPSPTG